MTDLLESLRHQILQEALKLVPFDGWNIRTLERAAHAVTKDSAAFHRAFPGGVDEVLTYYSLAIDQRMRETLAAKDLASMKIRQRIATAVRTRLELLRPHREAERRAVAYLAMPWRTGQALATLYRTVDDMWHAAGDTSTDFNFYTKRLLLAKVYSATLLHWLNDDSLMQEESWAFLDRRIEDVMKIEKLKAKVKTGVKGFEGLFSHNGTKHRPSRFY